MKFLIRRECWFDMYVEANTANEAQVVGYQTPLCEFETLSDDCVYVFSPCECEEEETPASSH